MSRIGRKPITVPQGVTVTIEGQSTEHVWKATRSDKTKEK